MREFEGCILEGRYRLRRLLDQGAFGAVYAASQLSFGLELREVAVKVAKRPMDEREARSIFGDALVMAKVADATPDVALRSHFVAVYEAGICTQEGPLTGRPYMVMEFVEGGSLQNCLRTEVFTLTRALAYADQILEAMSFMHEGIRDAHGAPSPFVHRDLKPANLLVERRAGAADLVKVTDFGLAVAVDSLLGWVESGGDLAYLAPESFSHNICSPQSDVYSLALVFYEMLTGHNPFAKVGGHLRGSDEEKRQELRKLHLRARQLEHFALLEQDVELRKKPALIGVLRTALSCDMSARKYANAAQLRAAWKEALLSGHGPETERPWEKVRRLTGEAEQCFAVGDSQKGEALLDEAMAINRERDQVTDEMIVGRAYQLKVERLLAAGATGEAGRIATEGYHRRKSRLTCLSLAAYYDSVNPAVAQHYRREAASCTDKG